MLPLLIAMGHLWYLSCATPESGTDCCGRFWVTFSFALQTFLCFSIMGCRRLCRDEHEYSIIQIFEYFGPRIYIRIRIYYILDIRIYSNIRSKLRIYSNIFCVFFVFQRGSKRATGQKIYITQNKFTNKQIIILL